MLPSGTLRAVLPPPQHPLSICLCRPTDLQIPVLSVALTSKILILSGAFILTCLCPYVRILRRKLMILPHNSASHDILRLYDLHDNPSSRHSTVPFLVIPGPPRAGVISALYVDPSSRFMISTAGTRGWDGSCTEVLIGYEIGVAK